MFFYIHLLFPEHLQQTPHPKPVPNLAVDPSTAAQTLSGVVGFSEKVMTSRNPAPREMDACAQEHARDLMSPVNRSTHTLLSPGVGPFCRASTDEAQKQTNKANSHGHHNTKETPSKPDGNMLTNLKKRP